MLHRRRIQFQADALEQRIALVARVAPYADLDQFMREQRDVDFMEHRGRQSVVADTDDGVQRVRLGAQRAALGWR